MRARARTHGIHTHIHRMTYTVHTYECYIRYPAVSTAAVTLHLHTYKHIQVRAHARVYRAAVRVRPCKVGEIVCSILCAPTSVPRWLCVRA